MGKITLRQAALWCGGSVAPEFEDVTFFGANMDSRKLLPGQLFIALEGARDGHDFIDMAFEKGAAAVLCKHCEASRPAIIVDDPRLALGKIAAGELDRIGMKKVGVTGSVGKSTTKEMIACVLEGDYRVSKTPANFNNDLGMPMAILSMPEQTQVAVLEMGMSHFGEIAYLSRIARPDAAVIINVGVMHIENLGSRQGILQAKLEILEGMSGDSRLFPGGVAGAGDGDLAPIQRVMLVGGGLLAVHAVVCFRRDHVEIGTLAAEASQHDHTDVAVLRHRSGGLLAEIQRFLAAVVLIEALRGVVVRQHGVHVKTSRREAVVDRPPGADVEVRILPVGAGARGAGDGR